MPAKTTEKATWVRVRLATPKSVVQAAPTEGELVLRADRVAVEDHQICFLVNGETVYRLDRRYFRALTWFVDRPTFGEWLRARRAQFPNSHTRWSEIERKRLAAEVAHRFDWARIATGHGRTVSACKRQAAIDSTGRD